MHACLNILKSALVHASDVFKCLGSHNRNLQLVLHLITLPQSDHSADEDEWM